MSNDVNKPRRAIEAAFWFTRLRSERTTSRERRRFERWRRDGSIENGRHYEAAVAAWDLAGDAASDDVVLAMRREALAIAPPSARNRWRYTAMAASLLLALCVGLILYPKVATFAPGASNGTHTPMAYETAVGQRSTVSLPDGSVVDLNTDTLIEVRYAHDERRVLLHRGEALFDIARDEGRPFVVEVDDHLITALGTAFDVRRSSDEVMVILLEGKVTVERERGLLEEPEIHALEPGQQLVAVAQRPFRVETADLRRVVSWRDGLLVFTDETLAKAVEEINRYSPRKVILGADSMKELRIGGIFRAGSVDGFTAALESAFPLTGRVDEMRNVVVLEWSQRDPEERPPGQP